jgi:hypothetical protein
MVAMVKVGDMKAVRFSASLEQTKEHFKHGWHNWL